MCVTIQNQKESHMGLWWPPWINPYPDTTAQFPNTATVKSCPMILLSTSSVSTTNYSDRFYFIILSSERAMSQFPVKGIQAVDFCVWCNLYDSRPSCWKGQNMIILKREGKVNYFKFCYYFIIYYSWIRRQL